MTGDIPPPSPEVEALLSEERIIAPQSDEVRERILRRARAVDREGLPRRPASNRTLVLALAAAFTAVAVGANAYLARRRAGDVTTATRAEASAVPVLASRETETIQQAGAGVEALGPQPITATSVSGAEPNRESRDHESLGGEVLLLQRARQALARNEFSSAFAALATHERRFPSGRLAEEREALKVSALLGLDRREDAQRVAAEFRKRFPHSVLLPKMGEILSLP